MLSILNTFSTSFFSSYTLLLIHRTGLDVLSLWWQEINMTYDIERTSQSSNIKPFKWPWARSHLHLIGPRPSHASPSLPKLPTPTCVGTLPRWEPMWQYPIKITDIQVDINFIIPKLIDGIPSHVKGAYWLKWPGIVTLLPNTEEFPCKCKQEGRAVKEVWEGWDPTEWRCDLAWDT